MHDTFAARVADYSIPYIILIPLEDHEVTFGIPASQIPLILDVCLECTAMKFE